MQPILCHHRQVSAGQNNLLVVGRDIKHGGGFTLLKVALRLHINCAAGEVPPEIAPIRPGTRVLINSGNLYFAIDLSRSLSGPMENSLELVGREKNGSIEGIALGSTLSEREIATRDGVMACARDFRVERALSELTAEGSVSQKQISATLAAQDRPDFDLRL